MCKGLAKVQRFKKFPADWGMASTSKGKRERLQEPEAGAKRVKTARAENVGVVGVPPQISPTALSGNRVAWKDAVGRDWLTDVKTVVIGEGTPGSGQKYIHSEC